MLHRMLLAALAASQVYAAPVEPRTVGAPAGGDDTILNYALVLEYLESTFYQEGLKNFTNDAFCQAGFPEPFYQNLQNLAFDEMTHVNFLKSALGDKAVGKPTFAFPVKDARSFVSLASLLEGVGVSAYLGAAPAISNDEYLTAAGAILTVESRHSSYIRYVLDERPFPNPFDTPLDFNQVFTLASQFITGLPKGTNLPFKAFSPLTVAAFSGAYGPYYVPGQTKVVFENAYQNALKAGSIQAHTPVYAVFFSGLQKYYVPAITTGTGYVAEVPGANYGMASRPPPSGQTYVVLTTADGKNTQLSDANTISGVGILEVLETEG